MRGPVRATTRLLPVVAALAFPLAATGAPIQYDFLSGRIEIGVFEPDGTPVVSAEADLVGRFVTFDEAVPELVDFELLVDDADVDLGFFGSASVQVATTPGAGFSAPAVDLGGWYRWEGGSIDVIGQLTATGGLLQTLLGATPLPIVFTQDDAYGYFLTGSGPDGQEFGFLDGITVTQVELFGVTYKLQLKNGFKGAVPEPGVAALALLGLAALAARRPR